MKISEVEQQKMKERRELGKLIDNICIISNISNITKELRTFEDEANHDQYNYTIYDLNTFLENEILEIPYNC